MYLLSTSRLSYRFRRLTARPSTTPILRLPRSVYSLSMCIMVGRDRPVPEPITPHYPRSLQNAPNPFRLLPFPYQNRPNQTSSSISNLAVLHLSISRFHRCCPAPVFFLTLFDTDTKRRRSSKMIVIESLLVSGQLLGC